MSASVGLGDVAAFALLVYGSGVVLWLLLFPPSVRARAPQPAPQVGVRAPEEVLVGTAAPSRAAPERPGGAPPDRGVLLLARAPQEQHEARAAADRLVPDAPPGTVLDRPAGPQDLQGATVVVLGAPGARAAASALRLASAAEVSLLLPAARRPSG